MAHSNLLSFSEYGYGLLNAVNAAAARTSLGLGTIATQSAAAVAITGGSITGITDLAVADGGTGASTAIAACKNIGAPYLLGAGGNLSVTGSTSEVTLATITIPANSMGPNGFVEIVSSWAWTNNANNKIPRIKFGGNAYMTSTLTSSASQQDYRVVQNRGAANNQGGTTTTIGMGSSSVATVTSAVDTTADTTVEITGQLANSADTLTLVRYFVRVTYAA